MRPRRRHPLLRWLRASLRDTFVLFRDFRAPLFFFALTLLGGGALYHHVAARAGEPLDGYVEAVYLVLGMIFLQAGGQFPQAGTLQVFYFVMPLLGLGLLAQGAADFGVLLFNRRARGEPWEVAIASTFTEHVILVGLGHLGYRVVLELHGLGEDVAVVEADPTAELVVAVKALEIPVISGNAVRPETLQRAGIERARALVVCTNDDSHNLQIALAARRLNPQVRTVVRVFDEEFARSIHSDMGIHAAFSASAMAAPAVAAAAAQTDISHPMSIGGRALSVGQFILRASSSLCGQSVAQLEQGFDLSVVMLRRDSTADLHPAPDVILKPGDTLAVFAEPETLKRLAKANR